MCISHGLLGPLGFTLWWGLLGTVSTLASSADCNLFPGCLGVFFDQTFRMRQKLPSARHVAPVMQSRCQGAWFLHHNSSLLKPERKLVQRRKRPSKALTVRSTARGALAEKTSNRDIGKSARTFRPRNGQFGPVPQTVASFLCALFSERTPKQSTKVKNKQGLLVKLKALNVISRRFTSHVVNLWGTRRFFSATMLLAPNKTVHAVRLSHKLIRQNSLSLGRFDTYLFRIIRCLLSLVAFGHQPQKRFELESPKQRKQQEKVQKKLKKKKRRPRQTRHFVGGRRSNLRNSRREPKLSNTFSVFRFRFMFLSVFPLSSSKEKSSSFVICSQEILGASLGGGEHKTSHTRNMK